MAVTRQQRKARRKRIITRAVALAGALFPDDEGARKEWLTTLIAAQLDIPGLGEAAERRVIGVLIDLIIDIVDGEEE